MPVHKFDLINLDQNPNLKSQIEELSKLSWPEFLLHGDVRHWSSLFNIFDNYQLAFIAEQAKAIAAGHTVPFVWDGSLDDLPENLDILLHRAVQDYNSFKKPNCLSALAVMIHPDYRKENLSARMIEAMINLGKEHGIENLLAPLRPTLKSKYPEMPFDEYINMQTRNGELFDPWIRVHLRMGAEVLKIMRGSIKVIGTVSEWEQWTGMKFPDSGQYLIEGGMQPLIIDKEKNYGVYTEPNLWVRHTIA
jgi:hypothetical protein